METKPPFFTVIKTCPIMKEIHKTLKKGIFIMYKLWMVLTVLMVALLVVIAGVWAYHIGYELWLDSLTAGERLDLLKNSDMTLEEKLTLFR